MTQFSAFRIPHSALLLLISSCSKIDPGDQPNGPGVAVDRDPLSEIAMQEVVIDFFEFYGNTLYEHLKYRFTTNEPEAYLGPQLGTEMIVKMDSVRLADAGKSNQQRLTELQNGGYLTALAVQRFNNFSTLMASYGNSEPTFGTVWHDIRNFEMQIMENDSATSCTC